MYTIVKITLRSLVFGATIVSLLCKCLNSIFDFLLATVTWLIYCWNGVKHESINHFFFLSSFITWWDQIELHNFSQLVQSYWNITGASIVIHLNYIIHCDKFSIFFNILFQLFYFQNLSSTELKAHFLLHVARRTFIWQS